jgi:hypothetical protein
MLLTRILVQSISLRWSSYVLLAQGYKHSAPPELKRLVHIAVVILIALLLLA